MQLVDVSAVQVATLNTAPTIALDTFELQRPVPVMYFHGTADTIVAWDGPDDATAAIEFLRNLKTPEQFPLVGKDVGIYGLEMGSLAAISAAGKDDQIKARFRIFCQPFERISLDRFMRTTRHRWFGII